MLVLARKVGQTIRIGRDIYVTFLSHPQKSYIRLGITAPREIEIVRGEIDHYPSSPSRTKEKENGN